MGVQASKCLTCQTASTGKAANAACNSPRSATTPAALPPPSDLVRMTGGVDWESLPAGSKPDMELAELLAELCEMAYASKSKLWLSALPEPSSPAGWPAHLRYWLGDLLRLGVIQPRHQHRWGLQTLPDEYDRLDGKAKFKNGVFSEPTTDVQGLILTQRHTWRVLVLFRGTESLSDWRTNADGRIVAVAGGVGGAHRGFLRAYLSVATELRSIVLGLFASGYKELVIAGHSMGGALATLAAADLSVRLEEAAAAAAASNADATAADAATVAATSGTDAATHGPVDADADSDAVSGPDAKPATAVHVYTFGAPPVGDAAFCADYARRVPSCWRFVNKEDIVVGLSLKTQHAGHLVWMSERCMLVDPGVDPSSFRKALAASGDDGAQRSSITARLVERVRHHDMAKEYLQLMRLHKALKEIPEEDMAVLQASWNTYLAPGRKASGWRPVPGDPSKVQHTVYEPGPDVDGMSRVLTEQLSKRMPWVSNDPLLWDSSRKWDVGELVLCSTFLASPVPQLAFQQFIVGVYYAVYHWQAPRRMFQSKVIHLVMFKNERSPDIFVSKEGLFAILHTGLDDLQALFHRKLESAKLAAALEALQIAFPPPGITAFEAAYALELAVAMTSECDKSAATLPEMRMLPQSMLCAEPTGATAAQPSETAEAKTSAESCAADADGSFTQKEVHACLVLARAGQTMDGVF